jgi:hypothetical protein
MQGLILISKACFGKNLLKNVNRLFGLPSALTVPTHFTPIALTMFIDLI